MTLQEVQVKARFGHRDWLHWRDRNGEHHSERKSAETLKRCLLQTTERRCAVLGQWESDG
jgi:hypothetical protein